MSPLFSSLPPFWETPELPFINRLPGRGSFIPYPTPAAAKRDDSEASPWKLSLNGDWRFRLFDKPSDVSAKVVAPDYKAKRWDDLPVPSNWTQHGHSHPIYTNIQMPFENTPPHVPEANPTGVYRRTFDLPEAWDGRRVVLHFGGAESVLCVWVNGQWVGMSKDCRLPSEFDVTRWLHAGENQITAAVIQWSDSSYIEDQDQ